MQLNHKLTAKSKGILTKCSFRTLAVFKLKAILTRNLHKYENPENYFPLMVSLNNEQTLYLRNNSTYNRLFHVIRSEEPTIFNNRRKLLESFKPYNAICFTVFLSSPSHNCREAID